MLGLPGSESACPWYPVDPQPKPTADVGAAAAAVVQVWDTEICFVNSHLAAHQDKTRQRNANYRDIVRGIRMDNCQMDILTVGAVSQPGGGHGEAWHGFTA